MGEKNRFVGRTPNVAKDFLASSVAFIVALPFCLGIANACGVPPAMGLISGIVGGLIVAPLTGVPLMLSGPTASITVLVVAFTAKHGLPALGVAVVLCGVIQIAAGALRMGRWFKAMPPALIQGLLSGIGLLIVLSQINSFLDLKPKNGGLPNLLSIPESVTALWELPLNQHFWALTVSALTLFVLVMWKYFKLDKVLHIPPAVPAIGSAVLTAWYFGLPISYVDVPENIAGSTTFLSLDAFLKLADYEVIVTALTIAFLNSTETLLTANAIDQMHHGPRARHNKELVAQGIGHIICGFLGGLPIAGVLARSSVNLEAGATTRFSTIFSGLWILLIVLLAPAALDIIPTASLAALLVFAGFKLIDLKEVRKLRVSGPRQVAIYLVTAGLIVCTDLLTGFIVGTILALLSLIFTMSKFKTALRTESDTKHMLSLTGSATFLCLPSLAEALEEIPETTALTVDFSGLVFIDDACWNSLQTFKEKHTARGGTVQIDWAALAILKCPARSTSE